MTVGEVNGDVRAVSTAAIAEQEQFSFFCDAICGTYTGIRPERPELPDFPAQYASARLSVGIAFATMQAPGHQARRDRALVRRQPDDNLFLNFAPWNGYRATVGEKAIGIAAGQPFLLDNDQPFTVTFPTAQMSLFTLRLPRDILPVGSRNNIASVNGRMMQTVTGRLIAQQMRLLAETFAAGDCVSATAMGWSLVALLRGAAGAPVAAASHPRLELMKRYAQSRLGDPAFGIGDLARQFGCTPRTVQNHFAAASESFSRWLLDTRLDRARTLLANPASGSRSIAAIAHASGFSDTAHFHRRFKERFGAPPGCFRP